jgi:hypothetical protein
VQRRTGTGWSTLSTRSNTSGERLTLNVTAIRGAEYRVFWPQHSTASKPFTLNVQSPTGELRLTDARSSSSKIEKGASVTLSVRVAAQYSDKKFYPAPDGTKVVLQTLEGGSWKNSKTLFSESGNVRVSVKPDRSVSYRFLAGRDTTSNTLSVTVTVPQASKIAVDWPRTYYFTQGARFTLVIKTSSGSIWNGRTSLALQYRFSTVEAWRTLDTKTYTGSRLRWGWGRGPARVTYFRVIAPSLGLSAQTGYS